MSCLRIPRSGRPIRSAASCVTARSGHAAMPGIADNALVKAAPLIEKLGAYRPQLHLIPEIEAAMRIVTGETPASPENVLERFHEISPILGDLVEPLLSLTLTPTMAT